MKTWTFGGIPYGYRFNRETKTIEVFPEEAEIAKLICSLALAGKGISVIANYLNTNGYKTRRSKTWFEITVGYVLDADRLKFYRGFYKTGEAGNWPELITEEQYTALMNLKVKKRTLASPRGVYLLTGWGNAHCGLCDAKLKITRSSHSYYICSKKLSQGKDLCAAKTYRQDAVNLAILTHVRSVTRALMDYHRAYIESTREQIKHKTTLLTEQNDNFFTTLPLKLDEISNLLKALELPEPIVYNPDFTDLELLQKYVKKVSIFPDHIGLEYLTPYNDKLELLASINY